VRYPPGGQRGVAGTTRSSAYGRIAGYHAAAAEEICTLVQVETAEALANLTEIASVDGIDGVFIGPADLSASLGYLGQPKHPDVQAEIQRAAGVIRAAGTAPGILAANAEDAKRYLDWGYQFVGCGVDVGLLVKAVDALAGEMRS
jgi:4-hydroxy-2-oxoheptanedioate aldolase